MSKSEAIGGMPFGAKAITDFATGEVTYDRQYTSREFADYFASFIGNGVFPNPSTGFQVIAAGVMVVAVRPGRIWINGYYVHTTRTFYLEVDESSDTTWRTDRVVARLNLAERTIELALKKGTPSDSTNTSPPSLERYENNGDGDYYELGLANIKVNKGAVFIEQANITDTRFDNNVCGIVSGVVDQVDTTSLFIQFQNYFDTSTNAWNEAFDNQNEKWDTSLAENQQTWQDAYVNVLALWDNSYNEQIEKWDAAYNEQETKWNDTYDEKVETWDNKLQDQVDILDNWLDNASADISVLQSFFYYNWFDLPGCEYVELPKNDNGHYISMILDSSGQMVASTDEWKVQDGNKYYTEMSTYQDGVLYKQRLRIEYKDQDGAWHSDISNVKLY